MRSLSNGLGAVVIENGEMIGYRNPVVDDENYPEIGRIPLPASAADVELFVRLCLNRNADQPLGVTDKMFIEREAGKTS